MKQVVRRYGDGPVSLVKNQRMVLRFKGKRGDRVRLASVERGNDIRSFTYGTTREVRVTGRHSWDRSGFLRLRQSGWFSVHYRAPGHMAKKQRVQLIKQRRVNHAASQSTKVPRRRGFQYAVQLTAPRKGLQVVSFGAHVQGVLSEDRKKGKTKEHYGYDVQGQTLVVAPGLPVLGGQSQRKLSKPLRPDQSFFVLVDPSQSGRVTTTRPVDVGPVSLDGPSATLPRGGRQAVLTHVDAADLAASAQGLLNVRVVGEEARSDWGVLVLQPSGKVKTDTEPSPSMFQFEATEGVHQVLVFPTTVKAPAAQWELDSVADAGTITADRPPVMVDARPDGRYSLFAIEKDAEKTMWLAASDVTMAAKWTLYGGRIDHLRCPSWGGQGCGDSWSHIVTSEYADGGVFSGFSYPGSIVILMPESDQVAGSMAVRLTTTDPTATPRTGAAEAQRSHARRDN